MVSDVLQEAGGDHSSGNFTVGPAEALKEGLRLLDIKWKSPVVLSIGGNDVNMTEQAPELVKKVATTTWETETRKTKGALGNQYCGLSLWLRDNHRCKQ